MSHFSELNTIRVVEARVTIPSWGAWHADVTLEKEAVIPPTAVATLTLGGLSLTCTPWRPPVTWQGRTMVRLIGGAGGWSSEIKAYPYKSTAGVKLKTVLSDAATACGETIVIGTDRVLGFHYEREKAPAQRLLNRLTPRAWWIGADGITRTGDRATSTIGSSFSVIDVKGAQGRIVIATETPADFVPGRTFQGTLKASVTIGGVTHTLGKDGLRTEVLAA